jgi:peptide methionine sulfoxide reductase MsrB
MLGSTIKLIEVNIGGGVGAKRTLVMLCLLCTEVVFSQEGMFHKKCGQEMPSFYTD